MCTTSLNVLPFPLDVPAAFLKVEFTLPCISPLVDADAGVEADRDIDSSPEHTHLPIRHAHDVPYLLQQQSFPCVENQMNHLLEQQGYTEGLAHSINKLKNNFPLRIWIFDNSGSMQNDDGHHFVVRSNSNNTSMKNTAVKNTTTSIKKTSMKNTRDIQIVSCSRWHVSCWVRKKKYSDLIHHSYYDIIPSFIQSP
jgi:hypothetical protein